MWSQTQVSRRKFYSRGCNRYHSAVRVGGRGRGFWEMCCYSVLHILQVWLQHDSEVLWPDAVMGSAALELLRVMGTWEKILGDFNIEMFVSLSSEARVEVLGGGSLQIFNLTEEDAGVYTCMADSSNATIEAQAQLTIQGTLKNSHHTLSVCRTICAYCKGSIIKIISENVYTVK